MRVSIGKTSPSAMAVGWLVAAVALVAAPTAAAAGPPFNKPLGWYAEDAGLRTEVPTSVEFKDIAAVGGAVVAVGTDAGRPVVYSRSDAGWSPAPVDPPLPAAGTLTDVELGGIGTVGWALGDAGGQPLLLELADGVWKDRSTALAGRVPTALALDGADALIGDNLGDLRRVAPDGAASATQHLTGAGAINGIAFFSASSGLAVAGYGPLAGDPREDPDTTVRIYNLGDQLQLDADERSKTTHVSMTALAAVSATQAVAIDSTNATWRLTQALGQNDWIQDDQLPNAALQAVASVKGGQPPWNEAGWATEFLAGQEAGAGAIWQRRRWTKDFAAWNSDSLPAGTPQLNGVAAIEWDAAWAVGAGGSILHYWRPPDPVAEQAWREAEAQRQLEEQQRQEEQQQPGSSPTSEPQAQQTTVVSLGAWQPSGSSPNESGGDRILTNGVVVTNGETTVPKRRRLVKNVRATFRRERSGQRKLIVTFRLTRRARVRLTAKRGRNVIAASPPQMLRRGLRKLVLPVRGKEPPTTLKLVARPARRAM